jgi:hypothetical protein
MWGGIVMTTIREEQFTRVMTSSGIRYISGDNKYFKVKLNGIISGARKEEPIKNYGLVTLRIESDDTYNRDRVIN